MISLKHDSNSLWVAWEQQSCSEGLIMTKFTTSVLHVNISNLMCLTQSTAEADFSCVCMYLVINQSNGPTEILTLMNYSR